MMYTTFGRGGAESGVAGELADEARGMANTAASITPSNRFLIGSLEKVDDVRSPSELLAALAAAMICGVIDSFGVGDRRRLFLATSHRPSSLARESAAVLRRTACPRATPHRSTSAPASSSATG
jgi:hypothetical protein